MRPILENIVSLGDAAKLVHLAEKTLRNWRSQGKYPQMFVKLGGKVYVDVGEVERILSMQKEKAIEKARHLGLD